MGGCVFQKLAHPGVHVIFFATLLLLPLLPIFILLDRVRSPVRPATTFDFTRSTKGEPSHYGIASPAASSQPASASHVHAYIKIDWRKARERESATFHENRRAVGMLNPTRDKNEGTYRAEEGTTPPRTNAPTGRVDRNWTKSGGKSP